VLRPLLWLAAARVLKKNPELVEEFADKAADLLHDKNQGVALSGVTLLLAICGMQPAMVEHYRQHVPTLCKTLRALLQVGGAVAATTGSSPQHVIYAVQYPQHKPLQPCAAYDECTKECESFAVMPSAASLGMSLLFVMTATSLGIVML
jgi:hypothetical protein